MPPPTTAATVSVPSVRILGGEEGGDDDVQVRVALSVAPPFYARNCTSHPSHTDAQREDDDHAVVIPSIQPKPPDNEGRGDVDAASVAAVARSSVASPPR